MLKYKFDVMQALRDLGLTTYQIRKEKIFGENTLTKFRNGQMVSSENIDRLCKVLNLQPGEIIKYIPDEE